MRIRARFIAAAAAVGIAVVAAMWSGVFSSKTPPTEARGARPVPVVAAVSETRAVPIDIKTVGRIEAFASVAIKSRIDGQIIGLHFKEGDRVRQGELLFSLDRRALEAQLRQSQANLAKNRAQLAKSDADVARYTTLSDKGVSSRRQYDEVQATAAVLQAAIKADEAAVESVRIQLGYASILAPIDGRTGSILIHSGNVVKANDSNPLVVINQVQPINVAFSMPEIRLPELQRRMRDGPISVKVRIPGHAGPPQAGTLSFVDNAVDVTTGTIVLKAELPNADGLLSPGQFVDVTLTLTVLPQAVVVPSDAIQIGPNGNYLFVIRANQTVEQRAVELGVAEDDRTVIAKGLVAGEQVVTEGQLRLVDGAPVATREIGRPDRRPGANGKPTS